ncbi:hypothetical protein AAC03nite_14310 [Alicyclobacillus acidoterrestris]|nr:hypothetical protein AAC03nite_14310 [Alicyclobacillus acidoterrestris]
MHRQSTREISVDPVFGKEGILYSTPDLDDITRDHFDFDVAGHYHRKNVFEHPRKQVERLPQKNSPISGGCFSIGSTDFLALLQALDGQRSLTD